MSNPIRFCENCGAALDEDANFCESCGHKVDRAETPPSAPPPAPRIDPAPILPPPPVSASPIPPAPRASAAPTPAPSTPAPQPAPAYPPVQPYPPQASFTPPAPPPARSKTPLIIAGAGCLVLLCIAAIVAVVVFVLKPTSDVITGQPTAVGQVESTSLPAQAATLPVPATQRAAAPTGIARTLAPAAPTPPVSPTMPPQPTAPVAGDEGAWSQDPGQELTGSELRENFDSATFDWGSTDGAEYAWSVDGGVYNAHVKTNDYYTWAYIPVDFFPSRIYFDAAVLAGFEQGGYGVMCHIQDRDNYYYVSIDPENQEYSIGVSKAGEESMLLQDWWLPTEFLRPSVTAVNQVMVACEQEQITLTINGELQAAVDIEPATPGDMALLTETWENMPADGFKVVFDNLVASE